jgi:hypothetical protein
VPLAQLNLALHLDDQSPFWLIVEVLWYMELSFTHRSHAFSLPSFASIFMDSKKDFIRGIIMTHSMFLNALVQLHFIELSSDVFTILSTS